MTRELRLTEPLAGTRNGRDLGGIPVGRGGARIVPGRLVRAECVPGSATVDQTGLVADLAALGLRTVIDLRTDAEVLELESGWSSLPGVACRRVTINEGALGSETYLFGNIMAGKTRQYGARDLGQLYIETVERRASSFGAVVEALAGPDALPCLIHCTHGKDRTGLVVAVLLSALGVVREEVVADYVQTGINLPDLIEPVSERIRDAGIDPGDVSAMFETPEVAMHMLLDHVDSAYGGAERYLIERAGVAPETIRRLRSLLVEPMDAPATARTSS